VITITHHHLQGKWKNKNVITFGILLLSALQSNIVITTRVLELKTNCSTSGNFDSVQKSISGKSSHRTVAILILRTERKIHEWRKVFIFRKMINRHIGLIKIINNRQQTARSAEKIMRNFLMDHRWNHEWKKIARQIKRKGVDMFFFVWFNGISDLLRERACMCEEVRILRKSLSILLAFRSIDRLSLLNNASCFCSCSQIDYYACCLMSSHKYDAHMNTHQGNEWVS
jgi:hypothetical protein